MLKAQFKILVVDDLPDVRKTIRSVYLGGIGFRNVVEAKDGEMAWDRIEEGLSLGDPVRIVLCDRTMPRVGGIELLRRVRGDERVRDLPFLLLTETMDRDKIGDAIALGVTDFILKPVKIAAVRDKVSAIYQSALPPPVRPADLRILVAEDEPELRDTVADMFLRMGFHHVARMANVKASWAELLTASGKGEPYELIVSDWMMPNVSGLEFLKKVRGHPVLRTTPFFLMTAVADKDHVLEAIEAGATSYITKPFGSDVLREKLLGFAAQCRKQSDPLLARWRRLEEVLEKAGKKAG